MPRALHGRNAAAGEFTILIDDANDGGAGESSPRHDFKPANAAPKRRGRPPKVRHDSPTTVAFPLNGWGEPFVVQVAPGWRGYWPDDVALEHLTDRPWEMATWGDPRVISYKGVRPGAKGHPIKYREHTLMLMSEAMATAMENGDFRRQKQRILREQLRERGPSVPERIHGGLSRQDVRYREFETDKTF